LNQCQELHVTATLRQFLDNLASSHLLSTQEIRSLVAEFQPPREDVHEAIKLKLRKTGVVTDYQLQWLEHPTAIPLVLGDYVLLEPLGRGGMGQVFRARHRTMDRLVAIKVLPDEAFHSPAAVARFKREVRAAAKLIHPHIVRAYDAREQDHVPLLVMELVDGPDLASYAAERGPLPVHEVVKWIAQAAAAMAYAHDQGVIHRDLKPSNLLLDRQGDVHVLDLGLARITAEVAATAPSGEAVTEEGRALGTIDYMAPEQAEDARQADARSDIYSLGCTLYRLLAGRPPYDGSTKIKKLIAHREQPIPLIRTLRPDAPPELERIFQRMVAKRPADRFGTMGEVADVLRPIAQRCEETLPTSHDASRLILAPAPPPVQRTPAEPALLAPLAPLERTRARRTPGWAKTTIPPAGWAAMIAGALLLAAGIGSLVWSWGGGGEAERTVADETDRAQNRRSDDADPPRGASLPQPRLAPLPIYEQAELHQRLTQVIDAAQHEEELRDLYTEMATCLDQSRTGRWLIGAANTLDRRAYRFSTLNGELLVETLDIDTIEQQQLAPHEFRHSLPPHWLPPKDERLALTPLASRVRTYGDDHKDITCRFSYTGDVPAEALQLVAHLTVRAVDNQGEVNSTLNFEERTLPESPCTLTFELPAEASIADGAKLYVKAYLPTPDARYYRISNVIPLILSQYDIAEGHDADRKDIRQKLSAICRDDGGHMVATLTTEIAAAMVGKQQVRWVIRGGSTVDELPWEIVVEQTKWRSQRAVKYRPDDARGRGVSREGDPFAVLAERPVFALDDLRLRAEPAARDRPWHLRGTLQLRCLRAEPVEHLLLIYRVPGDMASQLETIDAYQPLPDDATLPQGEQAIDLALPADLQPAHGGELFLVGFVQNADETWQVHQLSNRVAWPP
jgi:hypothetical protein